MPPPIRYSPSVICMEPPARQTLRHSSLIKAGLGSSSALDPTVLVIDACQATEADINKLHWASFYRRPQLGA